VFLQESPGEIRLAHEAFEKSIVQIGGRFRHWDRILPIHP
jgi:hypothetical protein